jgi:hypothetical protein
MPPPTVGSSYLKLYWGGGGSIKLTRDELGEGEKFQNMREVVDLVTLKGGWHESRARIEVSVRVGGADLFGFLYFA